MIEEALVDKKEVTSIKSPMLHQLAVLKSLYDASFAMDRYTCIMACGTGKTLVALWHAEQIKAKKILVLLPTLGLMNQTINEWVSNTTIKPLRYICVCSDQTISLEEDSLQFSSNDLNFKITTQPTEVEEFLDHTRLDDAIVIFSTYHSATVVALGLKNHFSFDLIIYDEAHKTAGKCEKAFSYALFDKNIKSHKRLFLTATPRIIYKNNDKSGDNLAKKYVSMDNKNIYGDIVFNLNFRQAVKLNVIVDYKIIISVVTSDMVKKVLYEAQLKFKNKKIDALSIAHLLAIQHAVKKHSIKKLITYHSKVNIAKLFNTIVSEHWFDILGDFNSYHVNGKMASIDRKMNIDFFKNSQNAMLTNARCLTEGIDVPVVDMVAFLCSKKSRIDIVQAVGRVMRQSLQKKIGYVLIPFYVDSNNVDVNSLEEHISLSDYSEIFHVLKVLADYDDDLKQIISIASESKGERDELIQDIFNSKISIVSSSNELNINVLRRSISTLLVNNIGEKWEYYYGFLKKFKKERGHCHPSTQSGAFGSWINIQRRLYKRKELALERVEKLNHLGFIWDSNEASWAESYENLKKIKRKNEDFNLGSCRFLRNWVAVQRTNYKKGKLSLERIEKLNAINFSWDVKEDCWNECFQQLEKFKKLHGHCEVPCDTPENLSLRKWSISQRVLCKKNKLSIGRIEKLNNLEFIWDVREAIWNERYQQLKQFKNQYGHCDLPNKAGILGSWVQTQRNCYRQGKLEMGRVEKLNLLGINWVVIDDKWHKKYEELKIFIDEFGHQNIPTDLPKYKLLRIWITHQKARNNKGKLSFDRIEKLNSLGFIWNPKEEAWPNKYSELQKFKKEHGHCNVPLTPRTRSLHMWIVAQRMLYRKGELEKVRFSKLDELGVIWDFSEIGWLKGYEALKKFKEENGHYKIPNDTFLNSWVSTQRKLFKKGQLDPERILKLNELGISWDMLEYNWKMRYEELIEFKKANGHVNVLHSTLLGKWAHRQRKKYEAGKLSADRISKLQKIGFFH